MNYPQQQGYPGQPAYAPPPQAPQYQQPGYAPQYGPTPGYGYPPQQQAYAPLAPPQPEPVRGTLSEFMSQPSSEGKALAFNVPGTRYVGMVIRNVTDADIQAATDMITGAVQKYNDDRVKLVMKVPLLMQPSAAYPEGIGVWYVKGNERAELARAMEAAGAEAGPPRGGDVIDITFTHEQPGQRPGMNPRKVKRVVYTPGNGIAPELPQANHPAQPASATPAQFQQPMQAFVPQPVGQGNFAGQPQQPYGGYPQQPQYQAPPQPQFQPPVVDPAAVYAAATGQPMPPQYQQPVPPTPYQQPFPPTQPGPGAPPGAPTGYTNGAQPTAPASPSNGAAPPPDWPADVPFIPGLTVDMARTAQALKLGLGQPQQ